MQYGFLTSVGVKSRIYNVWAEYWELHVGDRPGPKIVWDASRPFPSVPPLTFLPSLFTSPSFHFHFPSPTPLEVGTPNCGLGSGGVRQTDEILDRPTDIQAILFQLKTLPLRWTSKLSDPWRCTLRYLGSRWGLLPKFVLQACAPPRARHVPPSSPQQFSNTPSFANL